MIKKLISIICIVCLMCTVVPVFTVSAADAETVAGNYFKENVVATDVQTSLNNSEGNVCTVTKNADNSVTFKFTPVISDENKVAQARGDTYTNFVNTGAIQITYEYQWNGTVPAGASYSQQLNLCFGNTWDYNFNCPSFNTDGTRYSVKGILDTRNVGDDGKWTLNWYIKKANSTDDYAYAESSKKLKSDKLSIQPHYRIDYESWKDTASVDMLTLDNFNITEIPVANIRPMGGIYTDEDNICAEIYLSEGYTSASLAVDGKAVAEYTPETYAAGNWKTKFSLSGVSGKDVPVVLTCVDKAGTQTASASINKVMKTGANKVICEENFDSIEFAEGVTSVTTYTDSAKLWTISLGDELDEKTGESTGKRYASIEKEVEGISTTPVYKIDAKVDMGQMNVLHFPSPALTDGYSGEVEFDVYATAKAHLTGFLKGETDWPTGGGWFDDTGLAMTPNEWHKVKFRIDAKSGEMHTYLDGIYVGTTSDHSNISGISQIGFGIRCRTNSKDEDCVYYFDNIKMKTWAHPVQNLKAEKGANGVNVTFTGAADAVGEGFGSLMIAAYDANGLAGVKALSPVSDEAGLKTYTASFENISSFTKAKVMFWESISGLKPILGAVEAADAAVAE